MQKLLEMSSTDVNVNRNPIKEEGDIDFLLSLGSVQFSRMVISKDSDRLKCLKFQDRWYEGRQWPEYSLTEDKASCFYWRVFKPAVNG